MPDAIDDLFRRFGKAFNKADVEEIAACVTDDFEWRLAAGTRPAGTVLKGKDKWEIGRDAGTTMSGDPKVGDKVTVEYRMTATKVDTKSGGKAAPKGKP